MPKGKRGDHRPLYAKEDFDAAVQAEEEEKKKKAESGDGGEAQAELPMKIEEPNPIRNGMMLAHFVKAHFDRDDGDRYIGFEVSFPVGKNHQNYLPPEMQRGYRIVQGGNCKSHELESVDPQTVTLALVPDMDGHDPREKCALTLVAALVERATFSRVEESGAGKVKKIIRVKFKLTVDFQPQARDFATEYFGTDIWLSMKKTSPSLIDKD